MAAGRIHLPNPDSCLRAVFGLAAILMLAGCASGGSGRGRVSDAAAAAARDPAPGRGTGAVRTKDDHKTNTRAPGAAADDQYEDETEDDESFLGGLVTSLLFGGGDKDESPAEPELAPLPLPVPPPYWEFAEPDDDDKDAADHTAGATVASPRNSSLQLWWSRGFPAGDTIAHMTSVTLAYGSEGPTSALHGGLYYGEALLGGQEVVQAGISEIREVGLDVGLRLVPASGRVPFGASLLCGLRVGGLLWDYRQPIPVPDDRAATIVSDGVLLVAPCIGVGLTFLKVRDFRLDGNIMWGTRFMLGATFEGFANDLFRNVGELSVDFGARLIF